MGSALFVDNPFRLLTSARLICGLCSTDPGFTNMGRSSSTRMEIRLGESPYRSGVAINQHLTLSGDKCYLLHAII